ncbi:helix-turn-helix domain-containing protein [Streptococcus suis]|nr:helix-turn-helix transcriptional regulator [Streptococcus suis]QBX11444.1 repressor [Streptococcus satellite phage Javan574]
MAENIKRLLDKKGLNPRQMAIALDFKYTTVLDWVNAKTYPRIDKIEIMANFFGVLKSDLVEEYKPTEDSTIYETYSLKKHEMTLESYDDFIEEFTNMFNSLTKKQQTKLYKAIKKSLSHDNPDRKSLKKPSDVITHLNNKQTELKNLTSTIKKQSEESQRLEEEIRIGEIAFEILSVDDDDIEGQKQILEKYSEEDFNKAVEYIEKLDDPDDKDID